MAIITVGTMQIRYKTILACWLLSIYALVGFSTIGRGGIDFYEGTWQQSLAKAKSEKKKVFVYVYAKWCGQCKHLKRTSMRDQDVGTYYNKNFINIAIDGESAEGSKLRRDINVTSYPTLLILDDDGKLLTKATGVMKPYILINFGRRIVP